MQHVDSTSNKVFPQPLSSDYTTPNSAPRCISSRCSNAGYIQTTNTIPAKIEYAKNGHTRLHCAGVKLGLSYLGNFYKPFSASLGLRTKGHVRYAIRVKRH